MRNKELRKVLSHSLSQKLCLSIATQKIFIKLIRLILHFMSPAFQKYDLFLLIQPGKQEINTRKVSFCDWNAYKAYIADLNQKPIS